MWSRLCNNPSSTGRSSSRPMEQFRVGVAGRVPLPLWRTSHRLKSEKPSHSIFSGNRALRRSVRPGRRDCRTLRVKKIKNYENTFVDGDAPASHLLHSLTSSEIMVLDQGDFFR